MHHPEQFPPRGTWRCVRELRGGLSAVALMLGPVPSARRYLGFLLAVAGVAGLLAAPPLRCLPTLHTLRWLGHTAPRRPSLKRFYKDELVQNTRAIGAGELHVAHQDEIVAASGNDGENH